MNSKNRGTSRKGNVKSIGDIGESAMENEQIKLLKGSRITYLIVWTSRMLIF